MLGKPGSRRRVRQFLTLILTAAVLSCAVPGTAAAQEDEEPKLYAQSAVLMDGDTGRILYEKDGDTPRPMASTTKIMTCILALEMGEEEDPVTVSARAARQPKVRLGAPEGAVFSLKDLLYSLMLESHNDTAVMIAEHIGGSVEAFAGLMNRKARDLGCRNTCFLTPNGLDARQEGPDGETWIHSTTAADLAAMMRYCVWQSPAGEAFQAICQTRSYSFSDLEGKYTGSCVNHNALLSMMSGVAAGKTGYTDDAGYCYTAALEDGGRRFVIVLLGCGWPPHKDYKWSDARALLSYGLAHYEKKSLYPSLEPVPVAVKNGLPEAGADAVWHEPVPAEAVNGERKGPLVLAKEGERAEMTLEIPKEIEAPVYAGMFAGQAVYRLEGTVVEVRPLYINKTVHKITFSECLRRTAGCFLAKNKESKAKTSQMKVKEEKIGENEGEDDEKPVSMNLTCK